MSMRLKRGVKLAEIAGDKLVDDSRFFCLVFSF